MFELVLLAKLFYTNLHLELIQKYIFRFYQTPLLILFFEIMLKKENLFVSENLN
jgi:hypothetical protein